MFTTWKLLAARRDLAAALKFAAQRQDELQHLHEIVLPKIEQRIVAAEVAMLRDRCQTALANPRTPASHAGQLMTQLLHQQAPPTGERRWWAILRGTPN